MKRLFNSFVVGLSWLILSFALDVWTFSRADYTTWHSMLSNQSGTVAASPALTSTLYLPLVMKPPSNALRVNAPYFSGAPDLSTKFPELAIFWFGRVNPAETYSDVRIGYNDNELYVYIASFDRRLWYDTTPAASDLTQWDAVTLLLSKDGNVGGAPTSNAYRFAAQFNEGTDDNRYELSYRGNGTTWAATPLTFHTRPGWRGQSLNDDGDDKGWVMAFRIPFTTLGLSGPPAQGTNWAMALVVHDRDSFAGPANADKLWPPTMNLNEPVTWGQLRFGLPTHTPPTSSPGGAATIRHKLNGVTVTDGEVGGGTICGGNVDYWTQWGDASYPGAEDNSDFNIQNQSDVSDWPCFAKFYVTFPLNQVPAGKVIRSASYKMYHFGNSGDPNSSDPAQRPTPSYIQVLSASGDWNEATLSWNNAPLAAENFGGVWVTPVATHPGFPGVPYTWDVSVAVAKAYASGQSLRLVFYSADSDYHSGKYFISSDTGDWNEVGRPTLVVNWGNP